MRFPTQFVFAGSVAVLGVPLSAPTTVCHLPLDVMFLQDTTGSFIEDLPNVLKQLPDMVNTIEKYFPGSRFGVAEFKDKPYYPIGEESDFCYKLGDGKLSSSLDDFSWAYSLLYASGGGETLEAQFQALIDVTLDKNVGWRPLTSTKAVEGEAGARIVIMSTDAVSHMPGDTNKFNPEKWPEVPHNLPPNSGEISTDDVNFECLLQDYPSKEQMVKVLKENNIYLVILTPEDDPKVMKFWKNVNEDLLSQPADFYQIIKNDSSDLLAGVLNAVKAVTEVACPTDMPTEPPTMAPLTPFPQDTTAPPAEAESTTPAAMATTGGEQMTTTPMMAMTTKGGEETTKGPDMCHSCNCPCGGSQTGGDLCHHSCPCHAKCNKGLIIKIGNEAKHVKINFHQ